MIYTGIGARKTPQDILKAMWSFGRFMASWQHTLRSGGAEGADETFEIGCATNGGKMEIYLPYRRFRGNKSELFGSTPEARRIAKEFHPNWGALGSKGRDFMGRNVYQILGAGLDKPSDFVVCYTMNGLITGGTGQALRMAEAYKIPIFNFGSMSLDDMNEQITQFLIPQGSKI